MRNCCRKLQLDLAYVRARSVWLDARIIVCTVLKIAGLNCSPVRALLFPVLSRARDSADALRTAID